MLWFNGGKGFEKSWYEELNKTNNILCIQLTFDEGWRESTSIKHSEMWSINKDNTNVAFKCLKTAILFSLYSNHSQFYTKVIKKPDTKKIVKLKNGSLNMIAQL